MGNVRHVTLRDFVRRLQILHLALSMGTLSGVAVFTVLIFSDPQPPGELRQVFQFLVPIAALFMLGSSLFVYRMFLTQANAEKEIKARFGKIQIAWLARMAMTEAPALLAAVCAYLGPEPAYLILSACILVYMLIMIRPTQERILAPLQLSRDEEVLLGNPDTVVGTISPVSDSD